MFGRGQTSDDPREGLFFFGPIGGSAKPTRMRIGVVGTPNGIRLYRLWVRSIKRPIPAPSASPHHLFFPGFEEVFGAEWPEDPVRELVVSETEITSALRIADRHIAVYRCVSLFVAAIDAHLRNDDANVDLWFVIVPEDVYLFGRPLSRVPMMERTSVDVRLNVRLARRLKREPSLFQEDMEAAVPYDFHTDFHHQLKARLIATKAVTQILRESTLSFLDPERISRRRVQDSATVAWNLTTSSYFKAGGRPWKLATVREGTCYVGLVFRQQPIDDDGRIACCGAQLFLDSGDGLVFKGALGPWYSEKLREFHLPRDKAHELLSAVLKAYRDAVGDLPKQVVIHGRSRFTRDEWEGFREAAGTVEVLGVRILRSSELKIFSSTRLAPLRGLAYAQSATSAYLWSSGFIPKLATYPGREVPSPLAIELTHGDLAIENVLEDVMQLTKLNFNGCFYSDGYPVTLRFANSIGEILTSAPVEPGVPLPFRHYI